MFIIVLVLANVNNTAWVKVMAECSFWVNYPFNWSYKSHFVVFWEPVSEWASEMG